MAWNKPEAPVDELTHFPLSFVPDNQLPPMPKWGQWDYNRLIANFHHSIFRRAEVEGFGPGGEGARDARIQWTWWESHDRFHEEWGGLTKHMPRSVAAQQRTTLLGLMAYVPERGISFARPTPRVESLSYWQRDLLRKQTMVGNNGVRARRFLLDHSFEVGGPQVEPQLAERFLRLAARPSTKPSRLLGLAETIMQQTIESTLTPGFKEEYSYMHANNMLRPGLPRALRPFIRREIVAAFTTPQLLVAKLVDKCVLLAPKIGVETA